MGSAFKLLTKPDRQPKAVKGQKHGYMTFVLHLAPADVSGNNVCPMSSGGCRAGCLNRAGRGRFDGVQAARLRRTRWYFDDRAGFMAALSSDIAKAIAYAGRRGYRPAFRLNGTSDIPWQRVARDVISRHHDVPFYDYTKVSKRLTDEEQLANYALTYSLSEDNEASARGVLAAGGNVAVVFRDKATRSRYMVTGYMGVPVIDGDETDLRFLDPRGVIVGLYAKGPAKTDTSGFVRD
jgi:hypothetical protein